MTIKDLVSRNRSYRRFKQEVSIESQALWDLVELARLSASAANMQPLRYVVCSDREKNTAIFDCLAWAAYLKDWPGPAEGERPSGYIIILEDTGIAHPLHCDHGIATQSILLGATEKGLGGCIIGGINKPGLRGLFDIPENYEILLVLALGQPKETVVVEPLGPEGDVRYWRDKDGVHHVPKRALEDIVLKSV